MDRILFGDNQFFGINHLSEEKARSRLMRFRDSDSIMQVIDAAYDLHINTFMCTTHERIGAICSHIRANPERYSDFKIYPCMPYAHKYANMYTELGAVETLRRFMPGSLFAAAVKGGHMFVKSDLLAMMKLFVDAEMRMFEGIQTPVVFLQNIVTDLILGLKMKDFFLAFSDYVREKYSAEAGFITMNMPMLLDMLEESGIKNPIICSSINKIGFRMANITACERALNERDFRPVAMQVLAAGALKPREAIEYVCRFPNIRSILFGASNYDHIRQTKELIDFFSASVRGSEDFSG